jgi:Flp pilus assembly protein TadG
MWLVLQPLQLQKWHSVSMPRKELIMKWQNFFKSENGNVALTFGVAMIPVAMGLGAAIDQGYARSIQTDMQAAMDATVISIAAKGKSAVFTTQEARAVFDTNFKNTKFAVTSFIVARKASDPTIIVGEAKLTVKRTLSAVAGVADQQVVVSAMARPDMSFKVNEAEFKIDGAQGWWDKEFYVYTKDAAGNILTEQKVLDYDANYLHNSTTNPAINTVSQKFTIGTAYASWGIKMRVHPNGDGQRNGDKKLVCVTKNNVKTCTKTGTTNETTITPLDYYSGDAGRKVPDDKFALGPNDPYWNTAVAVNYRYKIQGNCKDATGEKNFWEDGGDKNFSDFKFTVKCADKLVVDTVNGTTPRLIK